MNFLDMWMKIIKMKVFDNSLEAYILSAVIFLGLVYFLLLFKRIVLGHLSRLAKKTKGDFDDFIVSVLSQIGLPVFIVISFYVATTNLSMADNIKAFIKYALIIVISIRAAFIIQAIVRYGVRKIYLQRIKPDDPAAEAMINSVTGILKWVIWFVTAIFVLDNLGVNISALVAGIGIGGIAVAMASQAVLGDAFSAASIFLDRPFEVGDFIIVDDLMGTVEFIGIKTTRIRSLGGEQLVFSNSDLTKNRIKNYKRMDTRRIVFGFGVVYQTSIENVKRIPEIVCEVFKKVDGTRLDRVHFKQFGDFSLNYEVVYFVLSSDFNIYMDKQQMINFLIMEEFEKEGIVFAYPTQTLYLNRETAKTISA